MQRSSHHEDGTSIIFIRHVCSSLLKKLCLRSSKDKSKHTNSFQMSHRKHPMSHRKYPNRPKKVKTHGNVEIMDSPNCPRTFPKTLRLVRKFHKLLVVEEKGTYVGTVSSRLFGEKVDSPAQKRERREETAPPPHHILVVPEHPRFLTGP